MKDKKVGNKKVSVAVILLIVFLMILGFLSFIFFYNMKNNPSEEDFVSTLTNMGEEIYTNYYYKVTAEGKSEKELKEFLANFKDMGLQFNLVELEKYSDENKEIIERFSNKNKQCKKNETMVIIYPKEPYSKTDFTSEIRMNCDYNKKNSTEKTNENKVEKNNKKEN